MDEPKSITNRDLWGNRVAIISPVIFVILSTVNIFIYRGGHATEYLGSWYDFSVYLPGYMPSEMRYHFLLNFFSDLGRITTYSGESNIFSATLFCITLTGTGLAFLFYYRRLSKILILGQVDPKIIKLIRQLVTLSAISFIGIGWAPIDQYPVFFSFHMIFVNIAFGSTMAICLLIAMVIFKYDAYPNVFAWLYLILFGLLLGFMGIMVYWGITRTILGYFLLIVGQKAIIYYLILNMFVQGIGSSLALKKHSTFLSKCSESK